MKRILSVLTATALTFAGAAISSPANASTLPSASASFAVTAIVGEDASQDVFYEYNGFQFSGNATVTVDSLPDGLFLNAESFYTDNAPVITIEGTPVSSSVSASIFTITDNGQTASFDVEVLIAGIEDADAPINFSNENCDEAEKGFSSLTTATLVLKDVCSLDGEVGDASTENTTNAFDFFGYVSSINADGAEFTINATEVIEVSSSKYAYVARDIWSNASNKYVDVYVTRTFSGNTINWDVKVYLAGTKTPSKLFLIIDGNLGSDEDTIWSKVNGVVTSNDGFATDPVIIYTSNGKITQDDGIVVTKFGNSSHAKLSTIIVGYDSKASVEEIDARINLITSDVELYLNENLPEVQGGVLWSGFIAVNAVAPVVPAATAWIDEIPVAVCTPEELAFEEQYLLEIIADNQF